jgi:HSP20 family protein
MFGNKSLTTKKNETALAPWFSGLSPLSAFRDDLLDIFDNFNMSMTPTANGGQFVPRIEVKDLDNSYIISAEVPGMNEKDMHVTVRENFLILEGEKKLEKKEEKKGFFRSELKYGSFYRAIPLTEEINPEKVTASYKNGILKVLVEKQPEAQRKSKRIPISIEGSTGEKPEQKH